MRKLLSLTLALSMSGGAIADTCMVSPTSKEQVSGRFGKFREGGAANFGSGNAKPHMHDGLDFSTSGQTAPLYATSAGTVTWAKLRGSAGNTVIIKRDNGQSAVYYHLSYIAVKEGDKVQAGQEIGRAGSTGMKPGGAVHLHFIYGVPNADDARAKTFSADANKNPTFNPAQLPNAISKQSTAFNYATDPSPYFCKTFPIQNDGLYPVLGSDTMAQYNKLFGAAPPMGVPPTTQFDPVQVAAANGDALQAAAKGATSMSSVLNDADGYGSLPSPPIGDYETMSSALPLGRQRAGRNLRAAAGQRAGLGEHNRLGIVLANPAHPLDALDQGHRAPQLGAVVLGLVEGLHGVDLRSLNKPPSLRHDSPSTTTSCLRRIYVYTYIPTNKALAGHRPGRCSAVGERAGSRAVGVAGAARSAARTRATPKGAAHP